MTVISPIQVNQPGVEIGLATQLNVDPCDTVALQDVTATPVGGNLEVTNLSMSDAPMSIGGVEYDAGHVVLYDLTVTGTTDKTVTLSVDFTYTTQSGDSRIVRQEIVAKPYFVATGGTVVCTESDGGDGGDGGGEYITGDGSITTMVRVTQAVYDALTPPDPNTFYVIVG